jgi:ubiquinone/menaquinone biosynthesis C-methylase UbiE
MHTGVNEEGPPIRASHRHPIFAALYDRLTRSAERKFLGGHRAWLAARARGHVLDVGAGTGGNFPYLRAGLQITAVEPDPSMRRRAEARARTLGLRIAVLPDAAEALSLRTASVDTALVTLVLCTVEDLGATLGEIRRVLRSDGRMLFLEHVRLDHPLWGRLQDWAAPLWRRLAAGCHPNRDTVRAIERAGFELEAVERFAFGAVPGPLWARGIARPV